MQKHVGSGPLVAAVLLLMAYMLTQLFATPAAEEIMTPAQIKMAVVH